jgi:hypothetical protein
MMTFVKFNQRGEIVATLRVDSLPEGLQQPFVLLQPGESVAEVAPEEGVGTFSLADLHQGYQVDLAKGTLVPRTIAPEPAPKRARRAKPAPKRVGRKKAAAKAATRKPAKAKAPARPKKAPARKKWG